jgi:hypothetical protein
LAGSTSLQLGIVQCIYFGGKFDGAGFLSNLVWVGSKKTPNPTSFVGRSVLITQTIGKTPQAPDGTVAIFVKKRGDTIALPLSA